MVMDESIKLYIESLDDESLEHRLYVLDTLVDGSTEVVASKLLTKRQAMIRFYECSRSHRPLIVGEAMILQYRKLAPGELIKSSEFACHSILGSVGLLWELLARARDKKEKGQ